MYRGKPDLITGMIRGEDTWRSDKLLNLFSLSDKAPVQETGISSVAIGLPEAHDSLNSASHLFHVGVHEGPAAL